MSHWWSADPYIADGTRRHMADVAYADRGFLVTPPAPPSKLEQAIADIDVPIEDVIRLAEEDVSNA